MTDRTEIQKLLASNTKEECEALLKKLKFKPATVTREAEGATHAKPDFAGYEGVTLTDTGVKYFSRFGRQKYDLLPHKFGSQRVKVSVSYDLAWKKQLVIDNEDGSQEFTDQFETGVSHKTKSDYCDIEQMESFVASVRKSLQSDKDISNITVSHEPA